MPEHMNRGGMNSRGAIRVGRVTRLYLTADNCPVCDVTEPDTGDTWNECRFMSQLGGSDAAIYNPPQAPEGSEVSASGEDGAEVYLIFPPGWRAHPRVLAAWVNPSLFSMVSDLVKPVGTDTDYPDHADAEQRDKIGLRDYSIEFAGARFTMSEHGDLVLDTRRSAKPVRVQVSPGQALRISVDGEAEERVLLAGPLIAYLTQIAARLNQLGRALLNLEDFAGQFPTGGYNYADPQTGSPSVAPVKGLDEFTAGILASLPAGSGVSSELDLLSPGPDYRTGEGVFPDPSNLMVASAIKVSKRSVAEDEAVEG